MVINSLPRPPYTPQSSIIAKNKNISKFEPRTFSPSFLPEVAVGFCFKVILLNTRSLQVPSLKFWFLSLATYFNLSSLSLTGAKLSVELTLPLPEVEEHVSLNISLARYEGRMLKKISCLNFCCFGSLGICLFDLF